MTYFVQRPTNKISRANRKLVYGAGINNADYITQIIIDGNKIICPFYRKWQDMLARCYCSKVQKRHPTYIDCTVTSEWLLFSNFKNWMTSQNWQGKDLDKDIKIIGNKVYSPGTCLFVSFQINKLLRGADNKIGPWPIGVSFNKNANKFQARCGINGERVYLGLFLTAEEAHNAYKSYKHKVIIESSNLPENDYIREYLLNHAELLVIKIDQDGES